MPTTQKKEVVKFAPNVPVEVALKFALPGKIVSTQTGERVLYTLADDRVMFLDLDVARMIENLGVNVRENFFISRPSDGKKNAQWKVWLSPEKDHADIDQTPAAPIEEETLLERQLRESIDLVNKVKWGEVGNGTFVVPSFVPTEASVPPPAPVQADAHEGHHASNNGNGNTNGVNGHNGKNGNGNGAGKPASGPPAWAESLLGQTDALVDVYAAALSNASTKHGNQVKPEDVRSLLVTAFIQRSKVVSYGS